MIKLWLNLLPCIIGLCYGLHFGGQFIMTIFLLPYQSNRVSFSALPRKNLMGFLKLKTMKEWPSSKLRSRSLAFLRQPATIHQNYHFSRPCVLHNGFIYFSRFQGSSLPCDLSSLMSSKSHLFSFCLALYYCKDRNDTF